LTLAGMLTKLT